CAFSCFTVLPALLRLIDRRRRGPGAAEAPAVLPLAAARRGDNPAWLPALAGRPGWVMTAGGGVAPGRGGVALPGRLAPQPVEPPGPRTGLGQVGADADRAHRRGQLARPQLRAHAGGGASPEGALRATAGGEPGGRGGLAGAARPGPQAGPTARRPVPPA